MQQEPQVALVIGLGLIGGSLAGALKQTGLFTEIIGTDIQTKAIMHAQQAGYIDRGGQDFLEFASLADLVIVATYMQETIRIITELGSLVKPGTIIMDIGSTKMSAVEVMNSLPPEIQAIGGHPMTGQMTAQVKGIHSAIFRNRVFVLTPTERTNLDTLNWCEVLLQRIGAKVVVMDAERHDRLVAITSHLPRLLPVSLLDIAVHDHDDMTMQLAAGGFQEGTRKAIDSPEMWVDIVMTNGDNIIQAIRSIEASLESLAAVIEKGDEASIRALLLQAAQQWEYSFGDARQRHLQ
jgi:prephenate dehydrogenase